MSMKNNKLRNGILIGAVVLLALIAGTSAVTIVPAGHTGVIVTMGKVSDRVLSEGMHLKVPFAQQIVMMNNKIQKTEIDSNGVSKDLQTVSSGVAINYHINKDDSAKIYQSIGEGYADTVLQPAIQESMKAITAQYTAEELITKRSAVGEEIGATLAEKVQEYGILIDKFNIINFDFSEEFNAAIEQKQVAEQNKLRAETEKEQKVIEAQADAEQKVIAAKAEADAIRQKAEAEAEANEKINASLNENVLKYQQIEKWNGQLSGGFKLDVMHFVTWGEKQAIRDIKLEDGRILRVTVGYHDVVENFRTVAQQPSIHVQVYEPIEGTDMMRGNGLGYRVDSGAQQPKKNYKVLCQIASTVDDAKALALMKEGRDKLNSPFIM